MTAASDVAVRNDTSVDAAWTELTCAASYAADREPVLRPLVDATVLQHATFEEALAHLLAARLATAEVPAVALLKPFRAALGGDPEIGAAAAHDLLAAVDRNPVFTDVLTPFLYFKGFHVIESHRIAHWLWCNDRDQLATHVQGRVSDVFHADVHPNAKLGKRVFIDHTIGVVIGETATIADDVTLLHGVTLGATGKIAGDRHPKIGRGAFIGANASILGNITIGAGARIGAGSVVIASIPAGATAVGVPAKIVRTREAVAP